MLHERKRQTRGSCSYLADLVPTFSRLERVQDYQEKMVDIKKFKRKVHNRHYAHAEHLRTTSMHIIYVDG